MLSQLTVRFAPVPARLRAFVLSHTPAGPPGCCVRTRGAGAEAGGVAHPGRAGGGGRTHPGRPLAPASRPQRRDVALWSAGTCELILLLRGSEARHASGSAPVGWVCTSDTVCAPQLTRACGGGLTRVAVPHIAQVLFLEGTFGSAPGSPEEAQARARVLLCRSGCLRPTLPLTHTPQRRRRRC